ncbi:MAG: RdgB/HAM1 family non-canonical purine NTP pyrophosphatase [Fidelibacterota bacterium]|nr:MAG: RdgB/HAM1 family non-canonical purine NTP pyrophosphatase [Candidatus Neomarinimicrobiota bacterium]
MEKIQRQSRDADGGRGLRLVIATRNPDKLREIQAVFSDLPVELVDMDAFPQLEPIVESGTTLEENALLKARMVHQGTGLPAIADDTGLEVDTLAGAPGIYSARYAGPDATYEDNIRRLLSAMTGIPDEHRTARFRTCAAYVDARHELTTEGVIEGSIVHQPFGENGFGYDPIFRVSGTDLTFGQMSDAEKSKISHRARAFTALHRLLTNNLPGNLNEETPA